MKYLEKSFSVGMSSGVKQGEWERIFSKPNSQCKPIPCPICSVPVINAAQYNGVCVSCRFDAKYGGTDYARYKEYRAFNSPPVVSARFNGSWMKYINKIKKKLCQ